MLKSTETYTAEFNHSNGELTTAATLIEQKNTNLTSGEKSDTQEKPNSETKTTQPPVSEDIEDKNKEAAIVPDIPDTGTNSTQRPNGTTPHTLKAPPHQHSISLNSNSEASSENIKAIHLSSSNIEAHHNLLIMPEGFTTNEKNNFFEMAKRVREVLLEHPTYKNLLDKMNIYAYFVPSKDSGISHIALNPSPSDFIQKTTLKDTAFKIHYRNSDRAYFFFDKYDRFENILSTAAKAIPFTDSIIILANIPEGEHVSGRADTATSIAVIGVKDNLNDWWEKYLLWHEYAHALGGLRDEYAPAMNEGFNKTLETDPEKIRWRDITPTDKLFMLHPDNPDLILPGELCLMKVFSPTDFCSVCEHRLMQVVEGKKTSIPAIRSFSIFLDETTKQAKISWEPIKNATSYEFYSKKLGNSFTTEPYFFEPYDDVRKYDSSTTARIRAINDNQSSIFSYLSVYREDYYSANNEELTPPNNIHIRLIDNRSFEISWDSAKEYSGNNAIETWQRNGFGTEELKTMTLTSSLITIENEQGVLSEVFTHAQAHTFNNLKPDGTYKIKIKAFITMQSAFFSDSIFSHEVTIQLKDFVAP